MPCERALNLDQWKAFSKKYKPMRVWLWLVYKFTENYCHSRLFSEFIQTQKKYPNLITTCHIKLKFFLSTKLILKLFLAKYLISVTAPLSFIQISKSVLIIGIMHMCACTNSYWKYVNRKCLHVIKLLYALAYILESSRKKNIIQ